MNTLLWALAGTVIFMVAVMALYLIVVTFAMVVHAILEPLWSRRS